MRGFFGLVALSLVGGVVSGCGGANADVEGTVGAIQFGETRYVYFGGPFLVISMTEIDCEGLDFVRRNYEVGQAPTEDEIQALQFSYVADAIPEGFAPVAPDATVSASVFSVSGATFYESIASAGSITIDSVSEESTASGVFEGLAFDDGTLNGGFDAEWCRNLKAR